MLLYLGCGLAQAWGSSEINFDEIVFFSSWTKSGKVHFSNGEYHEPGAPGSAIELIVKLTARRAFGKLGGKEVGAVIVVTDPGGSGSFYDLALLMKKPHGWINQDVAFLGDRIKIRSLVIANDAIVVEMNTHNPGDAMCCPSRQIIQRFVLRDDRLIKMKEEVQGTPDPLLTDTVWKWEQTLYSNDTRGLPPNPENYTLRLLPDGKVSIRADCNRGGGVYTLRGSEISIEVTHTTRAACPPESLERCYIRDLNAAARYRIEGDFLYIHLKNDTGTMKFMRL
jgi:heat shock protein HslJ